MATRIIGGRIIGLQPVPALLSFSLQPLVAPAVGRALGMILRLKGAELMDTSAIGSMSAGDVIDALPPEMAADVAAELGNIVGSLRPGDLQTIVHGLLQGGSATVDGRPMWPSTDDKVFNELFAGRTSELWAVLWFAVQENFPDFFSRRGGSAVKSQVPDQSKGSSTSSGDGPSTGSSPKAG